MTSHHLLTLVSSVIFAAVIFALIAWGWRARLNRQSGFPEIPEVPHDLDGAASDYDCEVQYVCTTSAGDWLDRIAAHGLGMKANGQALVFPSGLIVTRNGSRDLWIAAETIEVLRRESGMAGKFVEKNGLAVITWRIGGRLVDTGLRTRSAADTPELLRRLREIAPQAAEHLPDAADTATPPANQPSAHETGGSKRK